MFPTPEDIYRIAGGVRAAEGLTRSPVPDPPDRYHPPNRRDVTTFKVTSSDLVAVGMYPAVSQYRVGFVPGDAGDAGITDPDLDPDWGYVTVEECLVYAPNRESLTVGKRYVGRAVGELNGVVIAEVISPVDDSDGGGAPGNCLTLIQNVHRGMGFVLQVASKTGACECIPDEPGTSPPVPQYAKLLYDKTPAIKAWRETPFDTPVGVEFCYPKDPYNTVNGLPVPVTITAEHPKVLHPFFFFDHRALPTLILRNFEGTKAYMTSFEGCDGACFSFAFGPRYEDCLVLFCTGEGSSLLTCPPNNVVRFTVCPDCIPAVCTVLSTGRTYEDGVTPKPLPPALVANVKLTGNNRPPVGSAGPGLRAASCYDDPIGWPTGGVRFALRPNPANLPVVGQYAYSGRVDLNPHEYQFVVDLVGTFPNVTPILETRTVNRITVELDYCGRGLFRLSVICRNDGCFTYAFNTSPTFTNCSKVWDSTSSPYQTGVFQNDPIRDVFFVQTDMSNKVSSEFEVDIYEPPNTVPAVDVDCPVPALPPPSKPAAPIAGACVTYAGLSATPAIPPGVDLRLTSSDGLDIVAEYVALGIFGPYRAVFEDPVSGRVFTFHCGAYTPGGPYANTHHTLSLTNTRGGVETRPALTDGPGGATFLGSLGVEYEVTLA